MIYDIHICIANLYVNKFNLYIRDSGECFFKQIKFTLRFVTLFRKQGNNGKEQKGEK